MRKLSLLTVMWALFAWGEAGEVRAQPAALDTDVVLEAEGGAALKVPAAWKEVRKAQNLVVREQNPDPAAKLPYYVLLASIEAGPPVGAPGSASPGVPWLAVRDNIVAAAQKDGRKVRLDVGEPWAELAGFEARRLNGELEAPVPAGAPAGTAPRKVALTLIALVKDQKLMTIGLVSEPANADAARELVAALAKTARLGR